MSPEVGLAQENVETWLRCVRRGQIDRASAVLFFRLRAQALHDAGEHEAAEVYRNAVNQARGMPVLVSTPAKMSDDDIVHTVILQARQEMPPSDLLLNEALTRGLVRRAEDGKIYLAPVAARSGKTV